VGSTFDRPQNDDNRTELRDDQDMTTIDTHLTAKTAATSRKGDANSDQHFEPSATRVNHT